HLQPPIFSTRKDANTMRRADMGGLLHGRKDRWLKVKVPRLSPAGPAEATIIRTRTLAAGRPDRRGENQQCQADRAGAGITPARKIRTVAEVARLRVRPHRSRSRQTSGAAPP